MFESTQELEGFARETPLDSETLDWCRFQAEVRIAAELARIAAALERVAGRSGIVYTSDAGRE